MRMRLKKHLNERLEACADILLAKECDEFYKLDEKERAFTVDLHKTFEKSEKLCLELGCGKGAYAIKAAKSRPDVNFVAVEKLSNVIVVACENAIKEKLANLKFLNCRAENLLCFLPQNCANEIVLNFSCPFPKKTYANRRLTSRNYLNVYKKLLTNDGVILQKTDDRDFFEFSLNSLRENGFEVYDINFDLPVDAPDNIVTEYESKFRDQGKKIYALKAKLNLQ